MIKNHKFLSLFAITLMAALLLSMSGKATSVYALADPVQAVSPIYHTQIYQLKDYIDNGGLSSGQLDIFYTLAGFYVLGQAGATGYKLVDPYSNSDSVWDWLKSCGIEVYNTVIGLIPDTARMPITGQIYSTIPFKKASQLYVSTLMGAAVKAATFSSYQDFKDDVINSQTYFLPWNLDVQKGMNSIFGIYDGIYEWQFDSSPFSSNVTYNQTSMSEVLRYQYNNAINNLAQPIVRFNSGSVSTDYVLSKQSIFGSYNNIFINTSDSTAKIVNDSGSVFPTSSFIADCVYVYQNQVYATTNNNFGQNFIVTIHYDPNSYSTFLALAHDIYNNVLHFTSNPNQYVYLEDFIDHVYVGSNWLNKQEIFNITDLNFEENDQEYYEAVPEEHDYLIDIKGILQDILNNTDLFTIFIDNLLDINGVPVHDDDLIRITTNIYDLLEQTNPVLPVNLNDVSDYMDNTYLDLVKEHGQNFGETIGEYVAFWHNSDPEITYVIFGALILTLVGAFIGKWGHS